MSNSPFEDKRAADLLARVKDDLASLRMDMKHLVRHTGQHTLPTGVRELVSSGRSYARDGIERVSRTAREHPAGVSAGGLLLLGAVAVGAYLLIKGDCCGRDEADD
ncbi:hypothetical protein HAHE_05730 [Haloferula helveola]|uniref:DUF3618 domain-containing protein n=1 Tax=Haloferula helveola TaxID=490095 RepID=A0ABN6GZK0_9BACT|nr:hypothetical protein HAHE_05730 [Haloferula helveola]